MFDQSPLNKSTREDDPNEGTMCKLKDEQMYESSSDEVTSESTI